MKASVSLKAAIGGKQCVFSTQLVEMFTFQSITSCVSKPRERRVAICDHMIDSSVKVLFKINNVANL